MKSRDFCYWLMGFFELQGTNQALTPEQVQIIKNHLKLVFLHEIDPSYSDNKIVQQIFQNILALMYPHYCKNILNKNLNKNKSNNYLYSNYLQDLALFTQ